MTGCGKYQRVHANYNGERLSKFCRDQHMVMVNTHYPRGGPTYWNALRGREVESRLDYILLPATRLQMVTHCFSFEERADAFSSFLTDAHVTTGR